MPWCRFGDNSATYPKLMMIAGLPGADDRAVNEVRGWLTACATQSAGHLTDYLIDPGTAFLFGGARAATLIDWCVRTELLTPVEINGVQHWRLIDDPEFIHIRTRQEVEWDRQRNRDTADPGLVVPVRLRDGDNCRYCGVLVQWMGRKSNRSAEYDHRIPGQAATVDTLVVACRSCNGSRKANPRWDADHPLRPVPTSPNYTEPTARFLTLNGYATDANVSPNATATSSADPAPSPTTGEARPAARREARPEVARELPPKSLPDSRGTGSPGSGRDGPVTGQRGAAGSRKRRRGSRGGNRPPRPPQTSPTTNTEQRRHP